MNNIPNFNVPQCLWGSPTPASYTGELTEQELIYKMANTVNTVVDSQNTVVNLVNNLDVQPQVDNKIDKMAESGELAELVLAAVNLNNRKFVLIGDSYGLTTDYWTSWQTYFDQIVSCTTYASALGGSGFIGDSSVKTFNAQMVDLIPKITDKTGITDVVVLGGYNDASTNRNVSDITDAMKTFKATVHNNLPNARIHVGFIGVDYRNTGMQATLNSYASFYETACRNAAISYIPHFQFALLNKSYIFFDSSNPNSGFHPNSNGNMKVAECLVQYLNNGGFDVIYAEAFSGFSVYTFNGNAVLFPSTGGGPLIPGGEYPRATWATLIDLEQNSNLIWGNHNTGNCFYSSHTVIQADGTVLGGLNMRIYDKQLQIANNFRQNTMTVTPNARLMINTIYIPFYANY